MSPADVRPCFSGGPDALLIAALGFLIVLCVPGAHSRHSSQSKKGR